MIRKPPIRTYQRKNTSKILTKSFLPPRPDHLDVAHDVLSVANKNQNDSLDYEVFDTTFDRIAKDARLPPPPPDTNETNSWYDSSFDSSNDQKSSSISLVRDISSNTSNNGVSKRHKDKKKETQSNVVKGKLTSVRKKSFANKNKLLRESKKVPTRHKAKVYKETKSKSQKRTRKNIKKSSSISSLSDENEDYSISDSESNEKNTRINEEFSITNNNKVSDKNPRILLQRCTLSNNTRTKDTDEEGNVYESRCITSENNNIKVRNNIIDLAVYTVDLSSVSDTYDNNDNGNKKYANSSLNSIEPNDWVSDSIVLRRNDIEKSIDVDRSKVSKECFVKLQRIQSAVLNRTEISHDSFKVDTMFLSKEEEEEDEEAIILQYESSSKPTNFMQNLVCSTPNNTCKKFLTRFAPISPIDTDIKKLALTDTSKNVSSTNIDTVNRSTAFCRTKSKNIGENNMVSHRACNDYDASISLFTDDSNSVVKNKSRDRCTGVENNKDRLLNTERRMTCTLSVEKNLNRINVSSKEVDEEFKRDDVLTFAQKINNSDEVIGTEGSSLSFDNASDKIHASMYKNKDLRNIDKEFVVTAKLERTSNDKDNNEEHEKSLNDGVEMHTGSTSEEKAQHKDEGIDNIGSENSSVAKSEKSFNFLVPRLLLHRLQDPIRITTKRIRYKKWDLSVIAPVPEKSDDSVKSLTNETDRKKNEVKERVENNTKKVKQLNNTNDDDDDYNIKLQSINEFTPLNENFVFLKPGKYWTRSLSILHNIKNYQNLDELAVGKGRKWRHSVNNIWNMQKQGVFQSCVQKNENDEGPSPCHKILDNSQYGSTEYRCKVKRSTSSNRFTRRISVRVIPDNKDISCIKDASFLKAYGITARQSERLSIEEPSQIQRYSVRCNDTNTESTDICSVTNTKNVILQRCSQTDYLPFAKCYPKKYLSHCRKIGEGVYGEVFVYENENEKSVIKIVPIEGTQLVNGEPQKKFEEILSEIVIAKELHNLRFDAKYNTGAFIEVKNIRCIVGKYPQRMIKMWKNYDDDKTSDNDCPSMFNEDQLYIALELSHGGQDLEAFIFETAVEAHALFLQAALALAIAEKALEFEHRDLHWGNILISFTDERYLHFKLDDKDIRLQSNGVKVSIIDFTLSRMSYEACSIFNDLALDPALFTAKGEYQFEIYRLMRDKVNNNWQKFEPYTNILWLHYTLDKMIMSVRYRKKNTKLHKSAISKLKDLQSVVLNFQSAFDLVTNCDRITCLLYDT